MIENQIFIIIISGSFLLIWFELHAKREGTRSPVPFFVITEDDDMSAKRIYRAFD